MAGGGSGGGGFESYLPIAAALAATVMTDGAAAPLLTEELGATGAAAVMGGGIGALTGGGVAALTGQDVMKNALMGGIGGASLGYGGLYQGAGDLAAGAPTALLSSGAAVSPTVAAADTTGVQAGSNALLNSGASLPVTPGAELGTMTPQALSQAVSNGALTQAQADLYGAAYSNAFSQVPANAVLGAAGTGTAPMGLGTKVALGGLGLSALMAQDNKRYGGTAAAAVPYTGGSLNNFHYSPANYHPDVVQPPNPPYQVNYSGYARPPGYAEGGLMQGGPANIDFMGGNMYPQSQQQRSYYATPTQMPTSAQQTAASYEPKTNPLTGEMTANMRGGGIANLGGYSDGGHMLKGPGDGMSDSIPATIQGKQPARLADSEFVVPADVVSHLGNGSSDAGAKKLYAMMNKVRKARTGKAKQAPAITADKYMPA